MFSSIFLHSLQPWFHVTWSYSCFSTQYKPTIFIELRVIPCSATFQQSKFSWIHVVSFEVNNFVNLLHMNAVHIYTIYGRGIQIQHKPSRSSLQLSAKQYLLLVSPWKVFLVGCCPSTLMQSEHEVCIAHQVEIILQTVENSWNLRNYPWKFSAIGYMTTYSRKSHCKKAVQLLSYLRVGADYFDNVRLNLVQQDCDMFQVPQ